ncbi:hypothetical protein B296_00034891 [Ensete ventricosum]|uniref:Uncharacterized protein n=1 Tax=Ensete ventricosum TaxID=4639 RepID=A0A427A709_ENSVE|nr:hypothetical protein B296_00034891 [Ensete ventricosum]
MIPLESRLLGLHPSIPWNTVAVKEGEAWQMLLLSMHENPIGRGSIDRQEKFLAAIYLVKLRVSFWERRSNFAGFASRDVAVAVAVATAIAVSLTHTCARRLVGLGSPVSTETPYRKDSPSRRSQHARPALVSLDESRPGGPGPRPRVTNWPPWYDCGPPQIVTRCRSRCHNTRTLWVPFLSYVDYPIDTWVYSPRCTIAYPTKTIPFPSNSTYARYLPHRFFNLN